MRSASLAATRATRATGIDNGYYPTVGVQRTGICREGGACCRESACRECREEGVNLDNSERKRIVGDGPRDRPRNPSHCRCQRERSPSSPNCQGYGPEVEGRTIKGKRPTGQVRC